MRILLIALLFNFQLAHAQNIQSIFRQLIDEKIDFEDTELYESGSAEDLVKLADNFYWSAKISDAQKIINLGLQRFPLNANLHIKAGLYLNKMGEFNRALDYYHKAIQFHDSATVLSISTIENRYKLIKHRDLYKSYNGIYGDIEDQFIFKFDPYLGTYPTLLNLKTGNYRILYPSDEFTFNYVINEEKKHLRIFSDSLTFYDTKRSLAKDKTDFNDLIVRNGSNHIEGTLICPESQTALPLVILIHGSGFATRYNVMNEAVFFNSLGFASFVYDKQGMGVSTGNSGLELSYSEISDIILEISNTLKKHPKIDSSRIGVWGHSEGGWVAPLAASKSKDLNFIIMSAGPAVSTLELMKQMFIKMAKKQNLSDDDINKIDDYMTRFKSALMDKDYLKEVRDLIAESEGQDFSNYVLKPGTNWEINIWRKLNQYKPKKVLDKIDVPVLALYGEDDPVMDSQYNARLLQQMIGSNATIKLIDDANHQFMISEDTYSLDYFQAIKEWLDQNVKSAN